MTISHIQNGELFSSVRTKLNLIIDFVNQSETGGGNALSPQQLAVLNAFTIDGQRIYTSLAFRPGFFVAAAAPDDSIFIDAATGHATRRHEDGTIHNLCGGDTLDEYGGSTPNQVATPTFSPGTGQYTTTQSVTLACATAGADIHYTTDGSTPTTSSPVYSSAISVTDTTTLKAIAVKTGMTNSAIGSAVYTFGAAVTYGFVSDTNNGTFPASIQAGDVIIAVSFDDDGLSYTPAGFSHVHHYARTGAGGFRVSRKVATGSETGSLGAAHYYCAVYRGVDPHNVRVDLDPYNYNLTGQVESAVVTDDTLIQQLVYFRGADRSIVTNSSSLRPDVIQTQSGSGAGSIGTWHAFRTVDNLADGSNGSPDVSPSYGGDGHKINLILEPAPSPGKSAATSRLVSHDNLGGGTTIDYPASLVAGHHLLLVFASDISGGTTTHDATVSSFETAGWTTLANSTIYDATGVAVLTKVVTGSESGTLLDYDSGNRWCWVGQIDSVSLSLNATITGTDVPFNKVDLLPVNGESLVFLMATEAAAAGGAGYLQESAYTLPGFTIDENAFRVQFGWLDELQSHDCYPNVTHTTDGGSGYNGATLRVIVVGLN